MDQDAVLRARVLLLSSNRRVLRGPDALWAYRILTQVSPDVYGSKLAYVLVEAGRSPMSSHLTQVRLALLEEAVEVAEALHEANPFRAKVLARALDALRQERTASAVEARTPVEHPQNSRFFAAPTPPDEQQR